MLISKRITLLTLLTSSMVVGSTVSAQADELALESVMLSSSNVLSSAGLAEALQTALQNNPAVKGQRMQLSVQQEAIDAAGAARYPTPSAEISSDQDDTSYLQLSQPLWTFGRIDSAIHTQQVGMDVEKLALLQVQRELVQETATAYAQVQSAQMKVTVAQQNLAAHQNLYDRIERRQQGQMASIADVNLAYARLLQAKADLVNYQGQLKSARIQLYSLTRAEVTTTQPIGESLIALAGSPTLKDDILANSAELARANMQTTLAKAQLRQKKTDYYPTLSFRVRKYIGDNYTDDTRVGVVFDSSLEGMGLGTYNQIQGAEKSIMVAQYQVDSTYDDVEKQIDDLLLSRAVQQDLRIAQIESVRALEQTTDSFLRQYEANRKSWVEVLNQQRELTNMRYSLISTDLQWVGLSVQLMAQAGQLDTLAGVRPE